MAACLSGSHLRNFLKERDFQTILQLCKGIFSRVRQRFRLVVRDICYAQIFEDFKQRFAVVTECNCTVVRILFFDQNMTIESVHFGNCKDTDGTEGTCGNIQNFALCYICLLYTSRCV